MTLKLLLVGKEKSAFQLIKSAFENEDVDIIVATSIGLAIFFGSKKSAEFDHFSRRANRQ